MLFQRNEEVSASMRALQARILHVGKPVLLELLQRHFAVAVGVENHEHSTGIVIRHLNIQISQKLHKLR
jgi:hypothetical protein